MTDDKEVDNRKVETTIELESSPDKTNLPTEGNKPEGRVAKYGEPICSINSERTSWIIIAKSKQDIERVEEKIKLAKSTKCDQQNVLE